MFGEIIILSAILASSTSVVEAKASDDDIAKLEKYPDWTGAMNLFQYKWTPYEVMTDDGYIITLMNVQRKASLNPFKKNASPIIVQGLMGCPADV